MGATLLEDTRQQAGMHGAKHEWWRARGVTLVRSKLPFGDYCLPPQVSVDTKRSIAELAQDIDRDHERFRRELVAARDAGCALYILVENDAGVRDLETLSMWNEDQRDFARRKHAVRRIHGSRLARACATMEERYGVTFLFCAPDEAAAIVCDLLGAGVRDE